MITSAIVGCVETLKHELYLGELCFHLVEIYEFALVAAALNVTHLRSS